MNMKNLIIFLVAIYLVNKILEFILKKSEKTKEKSKRKITMPALNSLSLYSYEDFKKVVKDYLLEEEFEIIDEEDEIITVTRIGVEYLVCCKQVKEYTEKFNKEDFYIFVADLKIKNMKNGMILTNGDLDEDIKYKMNTRENDVFIEYLDGNEFAKSLRRIKEKKLYEGGI